MVDIHVYKAADGWRSYITHGHKMIVLDGFFDDQEEAVHTAEFSSEYLFGT